MKVAAYKAAPAHSHPPRCPCSAFLCATPPPLLYVSAPGQVGFIYSLSGEKEQKISCHYVDVVAEVVVIVGVVVAAAHVVNVVVALVSVVTAHVVAVVVIAAVVASFHLFLPFFFSRAFSFVVI